MGSSRVSIISYWNKVCGDLNGSDGGGGGATIITEVEAAEQPLLPMFSLSLSSMPFPFSYYFFVPSVTFARCLTPIKIIIHFLNIFLSTTYFLIK